MINYIFNESQQKKYKNMFNLVFRRVSYIEQDDKDDIYWNCFFIALENSKPTIDSFERYLFKGFYYKKLDYLKSQKDISLGESFGIDKYEFEYNKNNEFYSLFNKILDKCQIKWLTRYFDYDTLENLTNSTDTNYWKNQKELNQIKHQLKSYKFMFNGYFNL